VPRSPDPTLPERPAYRPLKPIDWAVVEKMMQAGCTGKEIAGRFKMCPDTFYDRYLIEKGVGFSVDQGMEDSSGCGMLRARQFQSAMQGNTAMLKMLGEERLGQGKKASDLPPNEGELKELRDAIKKDLQPNDDGLKELDAALNESQNATQSEADLIVSTSDETL
jgi:hypothetical protein